MTAVFSAEYAASLVRRARDGATFTLIHPWIGWLPALEYASDDEGDYAPSEHWVEWYRETSMACHLAAWICTGTAREYGTVRDGSWDRARVELDAIGGEFYRSAKALGSLCQLPAEWTDAHREAAREIGMVKS